MLSAALVLVAAVAALVRNLSERGELYVEKRVAAAAYGGIFSHYLALSFDELQRQTVGSALQIQKSVPAIIRGAIHSTAAGAIDLVLTAGYLYWIVDLAPQLAALLMLAHAAIATLVIPWAQRAARRQNEVLTSSGEQSDRLLEIIDRIAIFRAESAFDWALGRWKRALRSTQEQELRLDLANAVVAELVAGVERLVIGVTVLWAAYACLTETYTLGEFFAVVAAASAASGALMRLIVLGSGLLATRTQLKRVDELLAKTTVTEPSGAKTTKGPRPGSGVTIDGVWFRYSDESPWVIQNLSMSFEEGTVNTIRWPSGRGKSTLLRLIAGLYVPEKGAITVSGLEAPAARHLVAYVPQNCPLFAGSLLYNLRLLSGATTDRIDEAAAATGLKALTDQWPMGLETIVAGGGANVSSGQRQLVIFTAALASRRPILLLDEATTHLDLVMRAGLQESSLLRGRTIVNVMHFDGSDLGHEQPQG